MTYYSVKLDDAKFREFLEKVPGELRMAIEETLNEALVEAEKYATLRAMEEMPSGGGTYIQSFSFGEPIEESPGVYKATLRNDHQWARAIEYGTVDYTHPTKKMPIQNLRTGKLMFRRHRRGVARGIDAPIKHPSGYRFVWGAMVHVRTFIRERMLKHLMDRVK